VIGLTTYRQRAQFAVWDVAGCLLPASYVDAVTAAGGIATLLPPQPVDAGIAAGTLARVDALVLAGGRDVEPSAYGRDPHPDTEQPDRLRDAWELALVTEALRRRMPILGICRGIHVLNVALGGTLHQNLPDVLGHTGHRRDLGVYSTSTVHVTERSRLADLVGESIQVKCHHHQAVDLLGDHLVVSATDEEGIIEAVEVPGPDFVVAVQWHPEESLDDPRLFAGLVDAARAFSVGRAST
jgi:putative glutamine amidotransferase